MLRLVVLLARVHMSVVLLALFRAAKMQVQTNSLPMSPGQGGRTPEFGAVPFSPVRAAQHLKFLIDKHNT